MELYFIIGTVGVVVLFMAYVLFVYARTHVPFVATPTHVLDTVIDHLPITPTTVIYDLGCGRGKFLFAAEKKCPKKLVGYELSPLHITWAKIHAFFTGSHVRFVRKNFVDADIQDATVIYLFLVPAAVQRAWKKISAECMPGTLVVTVADTIEGATPLKTIPLHPNTPNTSNLYFYQVA